MLLGKDHLTDDVILRLYTQTKRKMNKLDGRLAASRMSANDVVHEAIVKTMSGKRSWNPEKCPDLYDHLAGCVKSIISNTGRLKETKLVQTRGEYMDHTLENFSRTNHKEISFPPEQNHIALSDLKFYIDYISEHRNDLLALANAVMVDEISKPRDLAEHLDMTVREVNTQKVALKRVIKKLQRG